MAIVGYYITDGYSTSDSAWCPSDLPKHPVDMEPVPIDDDSESDTPTHCVVCETLLAHRLTPDGLEYVWENITEFLLQESGRGCILGAWWNEYGDSVKELLFHENTEPITEMGLTYVDLQMRHQPRRDQYSPGSEYGS